MRRRLTRRPQGPGAVLKSGVQWGAGRMVGGGVQAAVASEAIAFADVTSQMVVNEVSGAPIPLQQLGGSVGEFAELDAKMMEPPLFRYNKPPPATVPVSGDNAASLEWLAACLRVETNSPNLTVLITGGAEQSGHSANSHHYINEAIDVAGPQINKVSDVEVFDCAVKAGYAAGHFEAFPLNPNRNHWHLQMWPGNGVQAIPGVP